MLKKKKDFLKNIPVTSWQVLGALRLADLNKRWHSADSSSTLPHPLVHTGVVVTLGAFAYNGNKQMPLLGYPVYHTSLAFLHIEDMLLNHISLQYCAIRIRKNSIWNPSSILSEEERQRLEICIIM